MEPADFLGNPMNRQGIASYDISDLVPETSDDDEEDSNKIPVWVKGDALRMALEKQDPMQHGATH